MPLPVARLVLFIAAYYSQDCVFSIFGQGTCELFHFRAVMIRAAVNIPSHVFSPEYLCLRVELLDWQIFNLAC